MRCIPNHTYAKGVMQRENSSLSSKSVGICPIHLFWSDWERNGSAIHFCWDPLVTKNLLLLAYKLRIFVHFILLIHLIQANYIIQVQSNCTPNGLHFRSNFFGSHALFDHKVSLGFNTNTISAVDIPVNLRVCDLTVDRIWNTHRITRIAYFNDPLDYYTLLWKQKWILHHFIFGLSFSIFFFQIHFGVGNYERN